jgi:hypothetical protein
MVTLYLKLFIGDITTYADDMSDLFVKCFTQLSVQIPIISTTLALISKSNRDFPSLVIQKLTSQLVDLVSEDDVLTSKLCLRALACLASCQVLDVGGRNGFGAVLNTLLDLVENEVLHENVNMLQASTQVSCYLLASTLPWCVTVLAATDDGSRALLQRIEKVVSKVVNEYKSPYDTGRPNAIFHENLWIEEEDQSEDVSSTDGPKGAACWDSIWASCNLASKLALKALNVANSSESLSAASIPSAFEIDFFTCSGSLVMPWLDSEIHAQLSADAVILIDKPATEISESASSGSDVLSAEASTSNTDAVEEKEKIVLEVPKFMTFDEDFSNKFSTAAKGIKSGKGLGSHTNLNGTKTVILLIILIL